MDTEKMVTGADDELEDCGAAVDFGGVAAETGCGCAGDGVAAMPATNPSGGGVTAGVVFPDLQLKTDEKIQKNRARMIKALPVNILFGFI